MPSLQLMSLNSRRYNILISSNLKVKWYTCHEKNKIHRLSPVTIQHLYLKRNLVDLSFFVSFQSKHGTRLNPANCTTYNYLMSPMTIRLCTCERNSADNLARCSGQKSHWEHDHCEKRVPRGRELSSNYKHRGEAVKDW